MVYSDNNFYNSVPLGNLKKQGRLYVGDNVEIEKDEYSDNYVITRIFDRQNEITRPKVTNIDQLLIVVSAKPKPDYLLVDKLIINAFINNINPIIVVNKIDIFNKTDVESIVSQYDGVVSKIIFTSAKNNQLNDLKEVLKNKVSVFAGQSAVGKSSLLNCIDVGISQSTNVLSRKVERGKHTTRECTIFVLNDNIMIADTPGFSMLELDLEYNHLKDYYPEFNGAKCKFSNCTHIHESGCSVLDNLHNSKMNIDRYNRYVELFKQLKIKWEKQYD